MIGGINPANSSLIQTGNNNPARERTDVARSPAASPQAPGAESVRRDLNAPQQSRDTAPGNQTASEATDRRVELFGADLQHFFEERLTGRAVQQQRTNLRIQATRLRHGIEVTCIAISPSGRRVCGCHSELRWSLRRWPMPPLDTMATTPTGDSLHDRPVQTQQRQLSPLSGSTFRFHNT